MSWHIGRAWSGHDIEDECPCSQGPCGLVLQDKTDPNCGQHASTKTTRQGHPENECPAEWIEQ